MDEAKEIAYRLRTILIGYNVGDKSVSATKARTIRDAVALIESQAAELARLRADVERLAPKPPAEDERRPLKALFTPDDIAMLEGAATMKNPCDHSEATVADGIAEIVSGWFDGQMEGYFPPEKEADRA